MTHLASDLPPTPRASGYKCGPGFGTRGETAYRLRLEGQSWDAIAVTLDPPSLHRDGGNPASAMMNAAKKYAAKKGLDWPVPKAAPAPPAPPKVAEPTRTDRMQEAAYKARCEGKSWAEAAKLSGYKHISHAVTGAGKYATRHGLDWPIKLSG